MNLETQSPKKAPIPQDDFSLDDFEFKPITSGLGFNHSTKTTEVKPSFNKSNSVSSTTMSAPIQSMPMPMGMKKETQQVYQNDLSMFYGQQPTMNTVNDEVHIKEFRSEFKNASKSERVIAYVMDLGLILSTLGLVLTAMSRITEIDLMEIWSTYPNEVTPLVLTLFCGFYFIYFSIFEKTAQSTFGKGILGLRVVNADNQLIEFSKLLLRSLITLTNFVSLGLFSYFDLQNKVTDSKVVKKV